MNLPAWAPRSMNDWVALAGSLVFVMAGAALLARPDTVMLRLVALGWPAWAGWLPGAAYLALGLVLLTESARRAAAFLLLVASAAELLSHLAYRDTGQLTDAGFRMFLAGLVLWLGRGEGRGPG